MMSKNMKCRPPRGNTPNRRSVFKQIAGAITVAPIAAAAIAIAASPIKQAIAEYQAAAVAHDKAESAADEALRAAFPEPMPVPDKEEKYPAEIRQMYAESKRLYRVMDAAYSRVMEMQCTS